jgi:hypothetical protein
MSRRALLIGVWPVLSVLCATAVLAGELAPQPVQTGPSLDALLALGPYGALVWGAYLLGRGLRITVEVELSERDRALLNRSQVTPTKETP